MKLPPINSPSATRTAVERERERERERVSPLIDLLSQKTFFRASFPFSGSFWPEWVTSRQKNRPKGVFSIPVFLKKLNINGITSPKLGILEQNTSILLQNANVLPLYAGIPGQFAGIQPHNAGKQPQYAGTRQ